MIIKDKKPLVSVILPVYNTDKYLVESLDALVNQTLDDIEIICINDASSDNSLEILNEYASHDKRFIIINNTTNQGPSISRNIALEYVTGEYTYFYDSDDKIDLDAFEKLYDFAKKYNQDFVVFNAVRFEEGNIIKPSSLHLHSIPDKIVPKTNIFEHKDFVFDTTMWNKFIKSDFLKTHNFKFAEGRVYQDILFTMQMFCVSDCVGINPEICYYWRRRELDDKSITQMAYKTKNLHDRMFIIQKTLELLKSDEKYAEVLDAFYTKIIENDLIKFINRLDQCDEEFKDLMFGKIRSFVMSLSDNFFDNLSPLNRVKIDLYFNDLDDSLIELVRYQHSNNLIKKKLRLTKKENKKQIKQFKNDIKQIKKENIQLNKENIKLKSKNEKLQTDLDFLKTFSGWSKYKLKNIF